MERCHAISDVMLWLCYKMLYCSLKEWSMVCKDSGGLQCRWFLKDCSSIFSFFCKENHDSYKLFSMLLQLCRISNVSQKALVVMKTILFWFFSFVVQNFDWNLLLLLYFFLFLIFLIQIWKMPKLWVGFLKLVSQTHPHSFNVLLQVLVCFVS